MTVLELVSLRVGFEKQLSKSLLLVSVSVCMSLCVLVCVSCVVCMCACVFALVPWSGSQIKLPEVSFYLHHVGLMDRIQIT